MALFKKRPQTAQQKAQKAQMRIVVRLACCAYIIFYVILPLIREPSDEGGMNPTLKIIIIAAFIAITAVVIVVTVLEVVRNWKAGLYKASSYTDDEDENSEPEIRNLEPGTEDGEDDDEYDDDDVEYDEDDDSEYDGEDYDDEAEDEDEEDYTGDD